MDKVYKRLMEIKQKPGIYIGKPSVERLHIFLCGYIVCMVEMTKNPMLDFYPGFDQFVQKKYSIYTTKGWASIISFVSLTEEEAFYKFFELLDEFLKTQS